MKPLKIWRYILILFVLSLGAVYSLPNLYSPDPAVQISYINSNQTADTQLKERLREILNEDLDYSGNLDIEIDQKYALIRLTDSEKQLEVKELLSLKQVSFCYNLTYFLTFFRNNEVIINFFNNTP